MSLTSSSSPCLPQLPLIPPSTKRALPANTTRGTRSPKTCSPISFISTLLPLNCFRYLLLSIIVISCLMLIWMLSRPNIYTASLLGLQPIPKRQTGHPIGDIQNFITPSCMMYKVFLAVAGQLLKFNTWLLYTCEEGSDQKFSCSEYMKNIGKVTSMSFDRNNTTSLSHLSSSMGIDSFDNEHQHGYLIDSPYVQSSYYGQILQVLFVVISVFIGLIIYVLHHSFVSTLLNNYRNNIYVIVAKLCRGRYSSISQLTRTLPKLSFLHFILLTLLFPILSLLCLECGILLSSVSCGSLLSGYIIPYKDRNDSFLATMSSSITNTQEGMVNEKEHFFRSVMPNVGGNGNHRGWIEEGMGYIFIEKGAQNSGNNGFNEFVEHEIFICVLWLVIKTVLCIDFICSMEFLYRIHMACNDTIVEGYKGGCGQRYKVMTENRGKEEQEMTSRYNIDDVVIFCENNCRWVLLMSDENSSDNDSTRNNYRRREANRADRKVEESESERMMKFIDPFINKEDNGSNNDEGMDVVDNVITDFCVCCNKSLNIGDVLIGRVKPRISILVEGDSEEGGRDYFDLMEWCHIWCVASHMSNERKEIMDGENFIGQDECSTGESWDRIKTFQGVAKLLDGRLIFVWVYVFIVALVGRIGIDRWINKTSNWVAWAWGKQRNIELSSNN